MVRRAPLVAAFLVFVLLSAEGAPPPLRRFPFWACSDGKGAVSLFWLPVAGEWPTGGYRLERLSRGRATVVGGPLRPGQDAVSMMAIHAGEAEAVRALAEKIERGALTEDEKTLSISELGRAAAADMLLGRALGIRHTDAPGLRGKVVYRLTALDADGGAAVTMESIEIDPAKATPAPGRPAGLRAEEREDGVALFWTDPPASPLAPVVGYRVDRVDGGKRSASLTPKPLLLNRHLSSGAPEFLDTAAPRKKVTYQVRSVDVFGRTSEPVRTAIAVQKVGRDGGSPVTATAAKAATPAAMPAAAPAPPSREGSDPRKAVEAAETATVRREARAEPRKAVEAADPATARGESRAAASGDRATPGASRQPAARDNAGPEAGSGASPSRVQPARAERRPATTARAESPRAEPAASAPPARSTPATAPPPAVWSAAKADPTPAPAGPPPAPVIVSIAGMADRVVIRFRPGDTEGLSHEFLVFRSESPTGTGVAVGRPLPGNLREWEDSTVSAGQYFWYRMVAVDAAGNRGEPSRPKWVSTGSR